MSRQPKLKNIRRGPRRGFNLDKFRGAVVWGIILITIFLLSGGIFNLIEKPGSILQGQSGGYITVHPYMSEQTTTESLFTFLMYSFTFIGLFLSYRSFQVLFDQRKANLQLLFGLMLVFIGLMGLYLLIYVKG